MQLKEKTESLVFLLTRLCKPFNSKTEPTQFLLLATPVTCAPSTLNVLFVQYVLATSELLSGLRQEAQRLAAQAEEQLARLAAAEAACAAAERGREDAQSAAASATAQLVAAQTELASARAAAAAAEADVASFEHRVAAAVTGAPAMLPMCFNLDYSLVMCEAASLIFVFTRVAVRVFPLPATDAQACGNVQCERRRQLRG